MNQELMDMALKADLQIDKTCWGVELQAFAALVAAAEREENAKICETLGVHPSLNVYLGGPDWYKHGKECAAEIRARGETK
jgi:hypothetical protein